MLALLAACSAESCNRPAPAVAQRLPCTLSDEFADFELLISPAVQEELRGCEAGAIHFEGLALADRDLTGLQAPSLRLDGATWTGVVVRDARLHHLGLYGPGASFRDVDLRGADLSRAVMHDARLERVDLSGANLERASFGNVELVGVRFDGARMSDFRVSNETGTAVSGTSFEQAVMVNARISTSLVDVSFDRADLTGAVLWLGEAPKGSFRGAKLADADFSLTRNLTGVVLTEADVRGADFSGTDRGSPADCTGMKWDSTTTLPPGRTMREWCPTAPSGLEP